MPCLKCGKKTEDNQVFCTSCLETMEKYPVSPKDKIQIPHHPDPVPPQKNTHRKKVLSQEEQVVHLKKISRHLMIALLVVTFILGTVIAFMGRSLYVALHERFTGRNYTTVTTETTSPAP